jgi:hypothetical protein
MELTMAQRQAVTKKKPAYGLERLQDQTRVDEIMLFVQGHSLRGQARAVGLIADYYNMAPT